MECICRAAGVQDAAELKRLNDAFNGLNTNTLEGIRTGLEREDAEAVFVAQSGDRLVGFVCAQLLKSICYSVFYVEITELFVEEAFRKQGVGQRLMQHAEDHYRNAGIHNFQLFTGGDNLIAQRFYERNGYRRDDDVLYRKRDRWTKEG